MVAFFVTLAACCLGFVVLDFAWLSVMAPRFYRPRLTEVLRPGMIPEPALAFYAIYAIGMTFLVALPAANAHAPGQALVHGAILGVTAYSTYNLTNWTTLKQWSPLVAFVDIVWGGFLTAVSCWLGATLTQSWIL